MNAHFTAKVLTNGGRYPYAGSGHCNAGQHIVSNETSAGKYSAMKKY
jgi:hypothetical protein